MRMTSPLFCILFFLMTGCSAVQVSQDYDAGVDFMDFRTYDWRSEVAPEGEKLMERNPLLHKRFYRAIDRVLQQKGYVQSDRPDFLVGYDFSVTTRLESDPFRTRFGFGVGSYYRYGGIGINAAPDIHQYDLGMLVINFYSTNPVTLVWRGKGSERIPSHSTPENLTDMVNSMVEAILNQFPPGIGEGGWGSF
ncbi:DUF4136 domain-containing protein [Desulfopila inferna]|uniref:DUF4136 domain-containing protein n=1 Tax=Desulfopila inferna TaxID=468528 RepID=UPI0019627EFE|nr:DUF4136 domain-containing protein [Desulfopila inferna]MBM9603492.1 DUF4136 domain-containing protein [Desulfopila inferna]